MELAPPLTDLPVPTALAADLEFVRGLGILPLALGPAKNERKKGKLGQNRNKQSCVKKKMARG